MICQLSFISFAGPISGESRWSKYCNRKSAGFDEAMKKTWIKIKKILLLRSTLQFLEYNFNNGPITFYEYRET